MSNPGEHFEVFPWSSNFETGIAVIDEQHQRLVHLLNILCSHLVHQVELPELNQVFNELTEYAAYHFRTEEELWHEYIPDDPWEAGHKRVHEQFSLDIARLKAKGENSPLDKTVEEILSFLTHWLAFHILENDKRMAKLVLAMQSGKTLEQARKQSESEMSGAMKVLVETVLSMYDALSARTLQLMKEVIERQRAETRLKLAANAMENTLESICIMDADTSVIEVNPAFYQATRCTEEEVLGRKLEVLKSGLEDKKLSAEIWGTVTFPRNS